MLGSDVLKEMTQVSGGKAFFPKGAVEMDEFFEKISLEIRNIYSVGFYPAETEAGGKHRLKVEVKLPADVRRAVVRLRKYYMPPVENENR